MVDEIDAVTAGPLYAGDVGGEEGDGVAVEVAAGAVVVLGGGWVGVAART